MSSNMKHFARVSLSFLTLGCLLLNIGCGYPEVSPQTYQLSKALYTACNCRNEEHLDKACEALETAAESEEITEKEAKWLMAIVDQAREGEWELAATEARSILEDQVGRSGTGEDHTH